MSPAKNLGGGEGSKENFMGGGVKKFHEILQQICFFFGGGSSLGIYEPLCSLGG
jgi:hypothetical protein